MNTSPWLDPDRYFDLKSNGAHEWWYFDAISDDGRDVLVVIFYAGLPFDPSYGVAAIRRARNPAKFPQPHALDHAAVGLSWHRDGKQVAYALSGHRRGAFQYRAEPFEVQVATSRVARDPDGSYRLTVLTPAVDQRPVRASLRFTPAADTEPVERNLGSADHPHHWILAAPDCRVEGTVTVGTEVGRFRGRGYHDHNAGAEEMSLAMRRWEWGRVHIDDRTHIYYSSIPQPGRGDQQRLWITCRDGRPEQIRTDEKIESLVSISGDKGRMHQRNVFGLSHTPKVSYGEDQTTLYRTTDVCLDDGPFYRRWIADYQVVPTGLTLAASGTYRGIAELLDTRHMNRWYVNWMIPYRLKWPSEGSIKSKK